MGDKWPRCAGRGRSPDTATLTHRSGRTTVGRMSSLARAGIPHNAAKLLAAALFLAVNVSCTVNQSIVIKNDGSGTLTVHVEISKLLHEYVASLAELSGKPVTSGGKLFDTVGIKKDFESRPGITVKKIATPTPDSLDMDVAYASIKDIFTKDATLKGAGVLTFSESGGKKTVSLHLDRTNYSQLSTLFPLLNDPTFAGLAPQVNDKVTDDEYLEMVKFSLGDDGPPLLKKSFITLSIDPEGEIISQTGGVVSGGAVVFKIPLLRLLVLDKPLDYTVTFK
jgi:hypothetical protein